MFDGKLLTLWTVRLALVAYAVSLWLRMSRQGAKSHMRWSRLFWTAGFFAFVLHVALAFHFYHHWSHRAAIEATAKETLETVGCDSGSGLYANYLFAIVWGVDVAWWWFRPENYEHRGRATEWTIQSWLAFIAFNATVVFGNGAVRWFGMLVTMLLIGRWMMLGAKSRNRRIDAAEAR